MLYTHLDAKEPFLRYVRLQDELDVKDVVAQERWLIISGASDMGKTTILKWLTLVCAEKCLVGGHSNYSFPFIFDLGKI
ncbi:MAG: hypothetical protein C5S49_08575 [Candidatus Methanogaster sp.]|nr:MAG: hypothetical protein C5S49_08575 [ANME-2 cluster archaeon]